MNDDETTTVSQRLDKMDTLFKPRNWVGNIEFIKHLVLWNNVLVTVFADSKGGKTTFSQLLQKELDNSYLWKTILPFNSSSLITTLCRIVPNTPLANMAHFVEQINKQKKHFLLIIDDAHYLPIPFLQELLLEIKRFDKNNFFHVCLISNFTIAKNLLALEQEQFPNLIHSIELGSLTESETKTYLLKHLNTIKALEKKNLSQFYHLTKGKMALINMEMGRSFSPLTSIAALKKPIVKVLGAAVSVLLIIALIPLLVPLASWQAKLPKDVVKSSGEKLTPTEKISPLVSFLPPLTLASVSELFQGSPRNLPSEFYDENAEDDTPKMVVLDSVLVMPKTIHKRSLEKTIAVKTPKETSIKKILPTSTPKAKVRASYTIQVLASKNREDIKRFIATHRLNQKTQIFMSKRDGVNWYVLTLGEFTHKDEAKLAIKALPKDLLT